jgi:superfamily I DNA/RNA helicase
MNFTPSQRNAINHTPGSLQPIVCAGSGKMEVVGPAHGHAHNADQHSQPDQRRLGALVTVLGWLRIFRLDLQN